MGRREALAQSVWLFLLLGSVFFLLIFADFFFRAADFSTGLVAGFFLFSFVGKSAQENPPGKSPAESSKINTTKIPRNIAAEGPSQLLLRSFLTEIGHNAAAEKHRKKKKTLKT